MARGIVRTTDVWGVETGVCVPRDGELIGGAVRPVVLVLQLLQRQHARAHLLPRGHQPLHLLGTQVGILSSRDNLLDIQEAGLHYWAYRSHSHVMA